MLSDYIITLVWGNLSMRKMLSDYTTSIYIYKVYICCAANTYISLYPSVMELSRPRYSSMSSECDRQKYVWRNWEGEKIRRNCWNERREFLGLQPYLRGNNSKMYMELKPAINGRENWSPRWKAEKQNNPKLIYIRQYVKQLWYKILVSCR